MTNDEREALIEEAAKAIYAARAAHDGRTWDGLEDHEWEAHRDKARAAFAVFEQASTPTDPTWPRTNDYFTPPLTDGQMEQVQQCINDALRAQAQTPTDAQPRKVPHTGPGHASGDAGFCEGCLAERDQNMRGLECIPGEPFTLEDLAREHDNLAAHPTQMSQTIPAFHTLTAKALRWAAGFRRTAVQEPQDEPTDAQVLAEVERVQKAAWSEIHGQDPMRKYSVGEVKRLVYSFDNLLGSLLTRRTVQAEPTDAALLAAANAYMHYKPPYDDLSAFSIEFLDDMRAALRAAFQEGGNR